VAGKEQTACQRVASVLLRTIENVPESLKISGQSARIGGERVTDILSRRGINFDEFRHTIEHDVRYANITIIEGIGASQYGIGLVTARMTEAVLTDERAVMPVGSYSERYGVTLSLPGVVGRAGVAETLWPEMSNDEGNALQQSIEILQNAVSKYLTGPKGDQM
jgi:L-lactate dehydrogenase